MDEACKLQDIPKFIQNALEQLATLKSKATSVEEFDNDLKQIDLSVNINIIDFANKLKDFISTLKTTVTDINNDFVKSYKSFINNKDKETCKSNSDSEKTNSDLEGFAQQSSDGNKSKDNIVEDSDNDKSTCAEASPKKPKDRKKKKLSAIDESDNSSLNSDTLNQTSDELFDTNEVSTEKNNSEGNKCDNSLDSDKENAKDASMKYKEKENSKSTSNNSSNEEIHTESDSECESKMKKSTKSNKTNKLKGKKTINTDSDSEVDTNKSKTKNIKIKIKRKTLNKSKNDNSSDTEELNKTDKSHKDKKQNNLNNSDSDSDKTSITNLKAKDDSHSTTGKLKKVCNEDKNTVENINIKSKKDNLHPDSKKTSSTNLQENNAEDDSDFHSVSSSSTIEGSKKNYNVDKSAKKNIDNKSKKVKSIDQNNDSNSDSNSTIKNSKKGRIEDKNTNKNVDNKSKKDLSTKQNSDNDSDSDKTSITNVQENDANNASDSSTVIENPEKVLTEDKNTKKSIDNKSKKDKSTKQMSDIDSDSDKTSITNLQENEANEDSDSHSVDPSSITKKRKRNFSTEDESNSVQESDALEKDKNCDSNKNNNKTMETKFTGDCKVLLENFKISSPVFNLSSSTENLCKDDNKDSDKTEISENSELITVTQTENSGDNEKEKNETEIDNEEKEEKPKIAFIKCIDINKLLDPKVIPNNSVIILSSSESEIEEKDRKSTRKSKQQAEEKIKKSDKNKKKNKERKSKEISDYENSSDEKSKKKKKNTVNKSKIEISDSENSSDEKSKMNKSKKVISDSENSEDEKMKRSRFNRKKEKLKSEITKKNFEQFRVVRKRRAAVRKPVIDLIDSSSGSVSDSSDSSVVTKNVREKNKKNFQNKGKKEFEIDPDYDYKNDIKFKSKCYVSLPRIPVEKLKEKYLQEKEDAEINRLTNMKSLKRTRQQKGTPSSSDNEVKSVKKRAKLPQKKNNEDDDKSGKSDNESHMSDELNCPSDTGNKDNDAPVIPKDFLDSDGGSKKDSDSSDNDDKDNKKSKRNSLENKTQKKKSEADSSDNKTGEKKSENDSSNNKSEGDFADNDIEKKKSENKNNDDKNSEEEDEEKMKEKEKDKEKSKWRNDPLLRGKLSCSDSDDELIRFRNKKKKLEDDIRSEPEEEALAPKKSKTKKQLKRIARRLGSDVSSSEDEKENQKSDNDKDKDEKSSESEEEETKKKPVRRRIKRMKDSDESSEGEGVAKEDKKKNDDEEQSTRKKIRNVWSQDSLADTTKEAAKEEEERKKRIAERQKLYNEIYDNKLDLNTTVDKVVLDFNEETKEELLSVHPDLVAKLKPHQAKGVHFMWTACFESLERAKKTEGSGCILAHCMGLGKTLQVITLIHTLLCNSEKTNVKTVLVVCPLSTVLNWVSEFKKWLDDIDGEQVNVFDLVQYKQNYERLYQMQDWMKFGGVLVIGYDMFRNLSNPKGKRMPKKLVNGFNKVLLEPGPDLVICDEGHLLKNEKTGISIAMNRLKTLRRIVLTGTPLQNNLKEYFCMVQFVKPNLLGTYKEYLNRFVNPITNGQYTDSTPHDIQIMRKRAHVLHKMLDAVVERRDYNVLAPFLPPKHEFVLFITLTEVQIQLYKEYLTKFARNTNVKGVSFLFQDFQELQRICIHPRVLLDKSNQDRLRRDMEDASDDSEGSLKDFINDDESEKSESPPNDSTSESESESEKKAPAPRRTRSNPIGDGEEEPEVELIDHDEWWSKFCQGDVLENIKHSSKIALLFDILHQCEQIGDKILVFSQSLFSLNLIEYFLGKVDEATQSGDTEALNKVGGHSGSWALGLDYFRMDGSTSCDNRATWCKSFNNEANTRARLFLISTKAGGLGINLVAANRVIIFDVSWNPSFDIQSIYRVYRFGQTKPCYIYRFVTLGTMENKIYERQVTKQAISKRVIDEQQIDRHYNQTDLAELYAFNPIPDEERPIPLVPKDRLFADLLQNHSCHIFKYHEHNSLLEDKADEGLNEEERRAAWEEFENEKKAPKFNLMQTMVRNGMYETLRILVQEDNNGWTPAQINNILPAIVQRISEQVSRGDYSGVMRELLAENQLYENNSANLKSSTNLNPSGQQMYRRVEERHEIRVLEQRRMQMFYQQYLQQLRNASGGAPLTPGDMNKLAQMFSTYNQNMMQQPQSQPASSSSGVSFRQDVPPPTQVVPPPAPRLHPAVSEVVELND